MVDNAKASGLVFDEAALDACLSPKPFDPKGPTHDEWKVIPWGLPKHRTVPANAVLSNTVKLRMQSVPAYQPQNLVGNAADVYAELVVIPPAEL